MPIYNVAQYLEETLDSILNQSLTDFEVIAVNDGSTDNSEEILKKYQQKDRRIIYFSQENQGQSVARNLALKHASGEYIYMMDSDDVLSGPDVLLTCYEYAEKNHADFIFFDRDWLLEDKTDFFVSLHSTKYVEENKAYDGECLLNLLLDTTSYNCVVWLLLIKHEHLKHLGLYFYPGIIHEDELFTTVLMLRSSSIYCLKQSFVKHRVRSASTVGTKFTRRNMDCYLTVADELLRYSQASIIHKYLRYTLSKVFYTGYLIPYKDKPAVFWRAVESGYLKYIGLKSIIKFFTW